MEQRRIRNASAIIERVLLFLSVGFALVAVIGSAYLAHLTQDAHWMNRAGAAIVAVEGIIAVVEFSRRKRLEQTRSLTISKTQSGSHSESASFHKRLDILDREIRKAKLQVFVLAVFFAVVGELLHGFGDLLFESLW